MDDRYRLVSPTNRLGSPPSFIPDSRVDHTTCAFSSAYTVSKADAEAIHAAGTAAGFKGCVHSERLWIDVDSYEGAGRTEAVLRRLGYAFVAYDTGGRGAHFGIARPSLPSHLLPLSDKQWAREHVPDADLSLYWHLHLLRVPGAVHERTGRRKRLVRDVAGRDLILPPYRPEPAAVSPILLRGGGGSRPSLFDCFAVMSNSTPATGGDRHRQLVSLSVALRDQAQVAQGEALWWVLEVNRSFREPKNEEEVARIVAWAYGDGAV